MHGEELRRLIAKQIERDGLMTFARFMELCLYHPGLGYYTSGRSVLGKKGDYYTAPMIHPLFGAMMGRQIAQMWRVMNEGDFAILEMGGGEGYLCLDIMDYLQREEPLFYEHLQYHLVERSPVFRERQKALLAAHREKLSWHSPEKMGENEVRGCFLSNELVDAFPVHRVVMKGGRLQEVYVTVKDGLFCEKIAEPSTPQLEGYLRRIGVVLSEGQRAEISLEALRWLQRVAEGLREGFVITVDYGYTAEELYSPHRMHGTLVCYQGHRLVDDPYKDVGSQDITSLVDFTALITWGEDYGLTLTGLVPQYRFLLSLGVLRDLARLVDGKCEGLMERLTAKHLILPGEMGERFKVLIQHKGLEAPQLDGLKGVIVFEDDKKEVEDGP